jgi:hypothetical protein
MDGLVFDQRKPGHVPVSLTLMSARAMVGPGGVPEVAVVSIRPENLRLRLSASRSTAPHTEPSRPLEGLTAADAGVTPSLLSDAMREQGTWDSDVSLWHQRQLDAPNAWELDVPVDVIDEASALFERAGLREHFCKLREGWEWRAALQTPEGRFFAMRAYGPRGDASREPHAPAGDDLPYQSDLTWISVDDAQAYGALCDIFAKLDVERQLAPLVEHTGKLRVYSAFFVVRTVCSSPTFHTDWKEVVGTNALTLMTPLSNFPIEESPNGTFQLLNRDFQSTIRYYYDEAGDDTDTSGVRTYPYSKGKAIIFGSNFLHSTEPGRATSSDRPNVYLCFEFGSDMGSHWPAIVSTIGYQTRLLARYDGELVPGYMDVNMDAPVHCTKSSSPG